MEQGSKKRISKEIIVKNVAAMAIIMVFAQVIFRGCFPFFLLADGVESTYPQGYRIHTLPAKQVYIAGQDTELDLTGGEICHSNEQNVFPEQYGYCTTEYCEDPIPMEAALAEYEWLSVETDADFSIPGEYKVTFWYPNFFDGMDDGKMLSCSFPIVVIDPKDAVR